MAQSSVTAYPTGSLLHSEAGPAIPEDTLKLMRQPGALDVDDLPTPRDAIHDKHGRVVNIGARALTWGSEAVPADVIIGAHV